MRIISKILYVVALSTAFSLSSCKSSVFTGGDNEKKAGAGTPLYEPNDNDSKREIKIFHGVYDVVVRSKKKMNVECEGTSEIEVFEGATVITGKVPCKTLGVKELEIGDGRKSIATDLTFEEIQKFGLDSRVKWKTKSGDAEYSPYIPYLMGPLIQDAKAFENVNVNQAVSVRLKTNDVKKPIEVATGSVHIKTLETNVTYKPPTYPTTYDKVIRYQINSAGFEGLSDKSLAGIYQVYEYRWNTIPMVLLSIHIEGPVRDFEKSVFKGFLGDWLAFSGGLVIDMTLKELKDIPKQDILNNIK